MTMKALKAIGWGVFWFAAAVSILIAGLLGLGLGIGLHDIADENLGVVLFFAAGIFGMLVFGYEDADDEDFAIHRYLAAALFAVGFIGGWTVVIVIVQVLIVALVLGVVTSPVWGGWLLYRRRRLR